MTPVDTYRAARKTGKGTADSCRSVMIDHKMTASDVAEICWMVETGKPAPKWQHADGSPTAACLAWDRGAEVAS